MNDYVVFLHVEMKTKCEHEKCDSYYCVHGSLTVPPNTRAVPHDGVIKCLNHAYTYTYKEQKSNNRLSRLLQQPALATI